ncbi:diguanylate cyclase [Desulfurivibrio alkaliphilus]|uniref:diguanylate cyclase n=1 Tax=Desulfurivibrio alkaliphilus (strain DSM 19089 / UNIQEM U267 / AHT2) TaxID=589865 RepID=D6YZW1_DESAT|nr:diguanylate cyclase [Desulfurivibrio alkaliphilus]ADH85118.1 diguanylate cyclase [Desulfurivibrio alkaliphilus AHT 2]
MAPGRPEEAMRVSQEPDNETYLKKVVLACLQQSAHEEQLVEELRLLVRQEGDAACKVIMELLLNRTFSASEASKCWHGVLQHQQALAAVLGRRVTLTVAVGDYFALRGNTIGHAKLIAVQDFEALLAEKNIDFLTGLNNRHSLELALEQEFQRAARYGRKLSVLFWDLDSFKEINDQLGHDVGDQVLQHFGRVLATGKRTVDFAARYGGDEFVMLLPDVDPEGAMTMAERIRDQVCRQPVFIDKHRVEITLSGGIATYPEDASYARDLLVCADYAMLQAKGRGKNSVMRYGVTEKRAAPRLDLAVPLTVSRLDEQAGSDLAAAMAKNISHSGMLLESRLPVNRGARLEMEITLEDRKLTVKGEVVRVEKFAEQRFGVGVAFLKSEGMADDFLHDYLRRAHGLRRGGPVDNSMEQPDRRVVWGNEIIQAGMLALMIFPVYGLQVLLKGVTAG